MCVQLKDGVNINDLVYKRADEQHFRQKKSTLKIYELDELDGGVYTCMSNNETYSFHLQVAFAPYFVKYQPETMMIGRNETVVFDCKAKGFPKPKVSIITAGTMCNTIIRDKNNS